MKLDLKKLCIVHNSDKVAVAAFYDTEFVDVQSEAIDFASELEEITGLKFSCDPLYNFANSNNTKGYKDGYREARRHYE